jgi:uncharacterized protein
VKLVDVNLLVYAYNPEDSQHEPARLWLEAVMSGVDPVALTWTAMVGFVRVITNPRIFSEAMKVGEALDAIDDWLAQPCTVVVHPTERHPVVFRRMQEAVGVGRNLSTDAHLAALAFEHNAEMCSADADFARFPGIRWVDPLAPAA